jgi:sec-independent protein translocase protein TatA
MVAAPHDQLSTGDSMPNIGPMELLLILALALIVLGPRRLPEVGSALGKTIREFRKASTDVQESIGLSEPAPTPPIPPAPAQVPPPQPAPTSSPVPGAGSAPVAPRGTPIDPYDKA